MSEADNDRKGRAGKAVAVTWAGLAINLILTAFKFIAGFLGRSSAMIADAVHSVSDFATDIIVIWGFRFAEKPADEDHRYGHEKFETFVSLIVGILLFLVGVLITYNSIHSFILFFRGEVIAEPKLIALAAAVLSIIFKEGMYRYTVAVGRKINSNAVIANAWHHRSDAFSSIATMLGIGGAIILGKKWAVLDPLAALLVSFFIFKVGYEIIKVSADELLEGSLGKELEDEILGIIRNTSGVKNPHDMKTRKIGSSFAVDVHIEVIENMTVSEAHDIASAVEEKLMDRYGRNIFISVHIEPVKCVHEEPGGI